MNTTQEKLLEAARKASAAAHCPYSDFPVGAAVEAASGERFIGCNIADGTTERACYYGLARDLWHSRFERSRVNRLATRFLADDSSAIYLRKNCCQTVVVILSPAIQWMIVTVCTTQSHPH